MVEARPTSWSAGLLVFLAVLVASTGGVKAQTDCKASVDAKIMRKEEGQNATDWAIKVDVTSTEDCANVVWELVVNERSADGEERTNRKQKKSRVRSGQTNSDKITYRVDKGLEVTSWSVEIAECKLCGTAP